ncbi:MAG: hypothetical protein R2857_14840 [Vampirovibrionales bacterium]
MRGCAEQELDEFEATMAKTTTLMGRLDDKGSHCWCRPTQLPNVSKPPLPGGSRPHARWLGSGRCYRLSGRATEARIEQLKESLESLLGLYPDQATLPTKNQEYLTLDDPDDDYNHHNHQTIPTRAMISGGRGLLGLRRHQGDPGHPTAIVLVGHAWAGQQKRT